MRTACLTEATQNHRIAGFEKHETNAAAVLTLQATVEGRKTWQLTALSHVDDDCGPPPAFAFQVQVRERWNQGDREIVDAEVTQIFERAKRV